MADVTTQFVRITFNSEYRVVTFYENQPVDELKDLLTALFPDVSSGRVVPVGIERPADNVVVPLSTGAKFPEIMTGEWELLCVPKYDIEHEKEVLLSFVKGLFSQNYIGEVQLKDLMMLAQEEDRPMLAAYRSYLRHQDIRRLTETLIKLTTLRRAPLLGGEESRVANKLLSLLRVMSEANQLNKTETRVLADLIMAGDSVVYSAYDVAKISKDVDELMRLLQKIAKAKVGRNTNSQTARSTFAPDRRNEVLATLKDFQYLEPEELDALRSMEDPELLDDALREYDSGGDIETLLVEMKEIAQAEMTKGFGGDEASESDYDMSGTDRTITQVSRSKRNSLQNELPPRPNSPTPYEDDKHAVIGKMLQEGVLDEKGAQQLKRLIQEENHLVQTAFKIYESDDDLVDLRATLMRILEVEYARQALMEESQASSSAAQSDLDDTIDYGLDDSEDEAAAHQSIVQKAHELILSLADLDLFSNQERTTLVALLRQDGTKEQDVIISAYEVYDVDGDENDFVDTCARVVSHLNLKVAQDFKRFDSLIANVVENGSIAQADGEQVSLLFRQGDARLSAAWDVLNETKDISEFVDTLKRIVVRLQMDMDFQDTENAMSRLDQEKKGNISEVIDFMDDSSILSEKESQMLRKLLEEGDSIVTAAYDAFLSDQEFQDLVSALKMIAEQEVAMQSPLAVELKFERAQQEMRDLTDALKNEGDLQENEAQILQHLISNDDARLMGAYDVYAQMQDVDDLVDTMKRIVNRVTGDVQDESDSDSVSDLYQPGRKVYENDSDDDDIDDEEGEEQDDEIEYSSASSAFANESHQAVKGWSQSEDSDPVPSDYSQTDSMDEYSEDFESYKSTEDDKQSVRSVSRADGILICIFTMQEEGLISRESFDLLMDYYQSDNRIGAAYDSYMESGSLEDFADTCKRVVEIVENERDEAALLAEREQQQISEERDEAALLAEREQQRINDEREEAAIAANAAQKEIMDELDEVSNALDSYEQDMNDRMAKQAEDVERETSEKRTMDATLEFLHIIDDLELTVPEVSALETAVINGDPSVKACMKLYAQNKDIGDLQDTLKRIARQSVDDVVVEDIEEPADFSSIMDRLAKKGVISAVEQRAFNELWLDRNNIAMAALEVFEFDEDETELVDTLRRVAHRAHA